MRFVKTFNVQTRRGRDNPDALSKPCPMGSKYSVSNAVPDERDQQLLPHAELVSATVYRVTSLIRNRPPP